MTRPAAAGPYERWRSEAWRGWRAQGVPLDVATLLSRARALPVRTSRHARTVRVGEPDGAVFVKTYPAPDGFRAWRAFRMGRALAAAGFGVPTAVLVGRQRRAGLLVTRDVGGEELTATVCRLAGDRAAKRAALRALGAEVARMHAAGFVHGDLVPPNLRLRDGVFVLLDHDRTRRSRLLVAFGGRRNLVQLGRFVVPGLTLTDRARVLHAYAHARGLSRRRRRRLVRWIVHKTMARRCAIDHIPAAVAARAGFRELMRSGGPFDPLRVAGERA